MPHPDPRTPMLVIGTGELGQALLHALLPRAAEASVRVDVLVRSLPGPDAAFVRTGGRPVRCDVAAASEADLAELFSRYDTVASCLDCVSARHRDPQSSSKSDPTKPGTLFTLSMRSRCLGGSQIQSR